MYVEQEALDRIQDEYSLVFEKYQRLLQRYVNRNYQNGLAREYALHGFSRRLKILVQCIKNTFEILPPDRIGLPEREEISNAVINIQAFVFNVFGCTDNLAWIWVQEKGVTKVE